MTPYERGQHDCLQDRFESISFSSTGGLDRRSDMTAPDYVPTDERGDYLRGYAAKATELFGEGWQTVTFSWRPAVCVGGVPSWGEVVAFETALNRRNEDT